MCLAFYYISENERFYNDAAKKRLLFPFPRFKIFKGIENKIFSAWKGTLERAEGRKKSKKVSRSEGKRMHDIKSLQSSKAAMGPLRGWGEVSDRWVCLAERLSESSACVFNEATEGHILETGIRLLEGKKSEMLKGFYDRVRADSWAIRTIRNWHGTRPGLSMSQKAGRSAKETGNASCSLSS